MRAAIFLLVGAAALLASVELATRLAIHDLSKTLGRIRLESKRAIEVEPMENSSRKALIVGNSLMLAAVDIDMVNDSLRPDSWHVVRYGVEQTTYYDWYYGVKRLISDGARPSVFIVCFEPRHLVQRSIRGEIFAHYLMRTGDALDVARELNLTPSEAADLLLANGSSFWALRKVIRNNILGRLMPSLPNLTQLMAGGRGTPAPTIEALLDVGRSRLVALKETTDSVGAKLVLVLTPPLNPAYVAPLHELGEEIGVPILMPLADQVLTRDDYDSDRYHLNDAGRRRFSRSLVSLMISVLE